MKWWVRQRSERERDAELIKATPRPEDEPSEDEKGVWEFTGPDRSEERIAEDRKRQEEASLKKSYVFVQEPWVWKALEHAASAHAQTAIDAIDVALKKEDGTITLEPGKKPLPKWLTRVGVKGEDERQN